MATTSWAVLAAGFVSGGGSALAVGVAAVLAAAMVSRIHSHRIVAVVLSPVLAVVVIVPLTIARMPVGPHQALGVTASHYLRALSTGLWSTDAWTFIVGLSAILFVCGYWLGWMALHEHRGVLAVVPMYAVLGVDVLNAPRAAALALPVTLAIGLSLAVMAAAYLGSLTAGWMRGGIAPPRGISLAVRQQRGARRGRNSRSSRWCFRRSTPLTSRRNSFRTVAVLGPARPAAMWRRMARRQSVSASP